MSVIWRTAHDKKEKQTQKKENGKGFAVYCRNYGATTFGMAVYMLILAKTGSNLTRPDELLLTLKAEDGNVNTVRGYYQYD